MSSREAAQLDPANILRSRLRSDGSGGSGSSSGRPPSHPSSYGHLTKEEFAMLNELLDLGGKSEMVEEWRNTLKRKRDGLGYVPSDLTRFMVWYQYQTLPTGPMFKCHRPLSAVPPVPLVLLHRPFFKFMEDLELPPSDADMLFAWRFWNAVQNPLYVTNHKRMVKGIANAMERYLGQVEVQCEAILGSDSRTDAVVSKVVLFPGARFGVFPPLCAEFKSQASAGDPAFQNMCYALSLWRKERLEGYQPYMLLLNVTGPQVEVVAAAIEENGQAVWAETLAAFSCYPKADTDALEESAKVWNAVRLFVDEYEAAPKRESPVPWPLADKKDVEQPDPAKLIFKYADVVSGTDKCAKFCNTYSREAHEAWAPWAPELEQVSTVAATARGLSPKARWFMVKMEYMSSKDGWYRATKLVEADKNEFQLIGQLKEKLKVVLAVGHDKGYVHGDFRLDNLLLKRTGADYDCRVVDFEWSGPQSSATYPAMLNPVIKWSSGARYGAPIKKNHDIWFVKNLVEQLTSNPEIAELHIMPHTESPIMPYVARPRSNARTAHP